MADAGREAELTARLAVLEDRLAELDAPLAETLDRDDLRVGGAPRVERQREGEPRERTGGADVEQRVAGHAVGRRFTAVAG